MDLALAMVGDDARFVVSRPEPSAKKPDFWHTYRTWGAQAFFNVFGAVIEQGEFKISDTFETEAQACLEDTFRLKVPATGKPFVSDWALITRFALGKLVDYHIYEDTVALADAMLASWRALCSPHDERPRAPNNHISRSSRMCASRLWPVWLNIFSSALSINA